MLIYLLAIVITFYLLPLVFAGSTGSAMVLLLIATPIICLILAILFSLRYGFRWRYCLIVAILFLPTIAIFYNKSAIIYSIIFGGISLFGNIVGALIRVMLI